MCVAVPGNAEEGVELQTKVRLADGVAVVPSAGAVAPHVVLLHLSQVANVSLSFSPHPVHLTMSVVLSCQVFSICISTPTTSVISPHPGYLDDVP